MTLIETRRWRGMLVIGVMVAVAVVWVARGGGDDEAAPERDPPTTATAPAPDEDDPDPSHETDTLAFGPLLPAATGTALVARDLVTRTNVVDLDTGSVRALDRQDPQLRFLRVDRLTPVGSVLVGVRGGRVVVLRRGLDGPEEVLGPGDDVHPVGDRTVWVVDDRPSGDVAHLSRLGGASLSEPVAVPEDGRPVGATTTGLVIAAGEGGVLLERDGSESEIEGGVPVAAQGDTVLTQECDAGSCRLALVSTTGDAADVTGAQDVERVGRATFSPDGSRVALTIESGDGRHLSVVDIDTAAFEHVDGSGRIDLTGEVLWSPAGDWVFAETRDLSLLAWDVGSSTARVAQGVDVRQLLAAVPAASAR